MLLYIDLPADVLRAQKQNTGFTVEDQMNSAVQTASDVSQDQIIQRDYSQNIVQE